MRRGTTPTNVFGVDVDCTTASEIYITYVQNGQTIIEKTIEDTGITEKALTVELTQAETLSFGEGHVDIQIRVKFPDETALASNIIRTTVERILKEGAI